MTSEEIAVLAMKIVDDLFVNGQGKQASRLVLVTAEGRDLGGWCRQAAVDRITEVLKTKGAK